MKDKFVYQPLAGSHITFAIKEAMGISKRLNRLVVLLFNGIRLRITKHMSERHLFRQYEHWCLSQSIKYRRGVK